MDNSTPEIESGNGRLYMYSALDTVGIRNSDRAVTCCASKTAVSIILNSKKPTTENSFPIPQKKIMPWASARLHVPAAAAKPPLLKKNGFFTLVLVANKLVWPLGSNGRRLVQFSLLEFQNIIYYIISAQFLGAVLKHVLF